MKTYFEPQFCVSKIKINTIYIFPDTKGRMDAHKGMIGNADTISATEMIDFKPDIRKVLSEQGVVFLLD